MEQTKRNFVLVVLNREFELKKMEHKRGVEKKSSRMSPMFTTAPAQPHFVIISQIVGSQTLAEDELQQQTRRNRVVNRLMTGMSNMMWSSVVSHGCHGMKFSPHQNFTSFLTWKSRCKRGAMLGDGTRNIINFSFYFHSIFSSVHMVFEHFEYILSI